MSSSLDLVQIIRTFRQRRRWPARRNARETEALRGVSLSVPTGRIAGLMGRSGSGKTTLVRIASLLDRPDDGEVSIGGEHVTWEIDQLRTLRRRIGVVFQKPVVLAGTVWENVAFGLRNRRVPAEEVQRRVLGMLKRVGLEEYQSRSARGLSGGEAQRVAFARTAVMEPEVLLLDEFTTHLDTGNIETLEDLVTAYRRDFDATILLVTHSRSQASRLCERLSILSQGRIVEEGPAKQVLNTPKHPAAAEVVRPDFVT
jgi:ABC-type methionine transport system ATPase subunit